MNTNIYKETKQTKQNSNNNTTTTAIQNKTNYKQIHINKTKQTKPQTT